MVDAAPLPTTSRKIVIHPTHPMSEVYSSGHVVLAISFTSILIVPSPSVTQKEIMHTPIELVGFGLRIGVPATRHQHQLCLRDQLGHARFRAAPHGWPSRHSQWQRAGAFQNRAMSVAGATRKTYAQLEYFAVCPTADLAKACSTCA
jgi:hypothetical protein